MNTIGNNKKDCETKSVETQASLAIENKVQKVETLGERRNKKMPERLSHRKNNNRRWVKETPDKKTVDSGRVLKINTPLHKKEN